MNKVAVQPKNKGNVVIHPVLFSIFPILSLYLNNIDLVQAADLFIPLILSICFALVVYFLFKKTCSNKNKAGLISSLLILAFFSFGYCLNFRIAFTLGSKQIMYYQIFLALWSFFFMAGAALIILTKKKLENATNYFNIISIATTFYVLFLIIGYFAFNPPAATTQDLGTIKNTNINYPDVYYIILDAYARADVLERIYDFDNSSFIEFLQANDFYVAEQSNANFPETYYSMSSSLNFDYVNELVKNHSVASQDQSQLKRLLSNNKVQEFFKEKGYQIVSIPSIWTSTNQIRGDITLKKSRYLTEFDIALIDTTPLALVFGNKLILDSQRKRTLEIFENIPKVAEIAGPTFCYVHILPPHPPFLFDSDGNQASKNSFAPFNDGCSYFEINPGREDYLQKYSQQLSFVNSKTKKVIEKILSSSEQAPIIIVQGDHGPRSLCNRENPIQSEIVNELFPILNAYYLPDKGKEMLYDSITPVNSFRVVFNALFDAELELLEDRSFYVNGKKDPYKFTEVTKLIKTR